MLKYIATMVLASPLAMAETAADQPSLLSSLPMLIIFAGVTYFMIIRPQQTRQKEHEDILKSLKPGSEISAAGIIGKVKKVDDQYVWVEVANNVIIKIQKDSVRSILPKGTSEIKG